MSFKNSDRNICESMLIKEFICLKKFINHLIMLAILIIIAGILKLFVGDEAAFKIVISIPCILLMFFNVLRFINAVKRYINSHLDIPFSHEEIILRDIYDENMYAEVIYCMFDFEPLPSINTAIKSAVRKEFNKEMKELGLPSFHMYIVKNIFFIILSLTGLIFMFGPFGNQTVISLIVLVLTVVSWEGVNLELKS